MKKTIYSALANRHCQQAIKKLQEFEKKLVSPYLRMSIPFIFQGKGHFKSMTCMQNPAELESLYSMLCESKPQNILEIGTAKGGALYLWLQAANPKATVVSVDLPEGEFGGGYLSCRIPFYNTFAKPTQNLHLIRGDSHEPKTLERVKEIFKGQKIDFLFIDGDHTYEGVKQDFTLYSPLVAPGGIIALHDILPRPDIPAIQVFRFWEELKKTHETVELIGSEGSGRKIGCGIVMIPAS